MKKRSFIPLALLGLALSACSDAPNQPAATELPEFQAESLAQHISILASEEFLGRQPGTEGETLTVAYLTEQFSKIGLTPGNGDSFAQAVPYMQMTTSGTPNALFQKASQTWQPVVGTDIVLSSRSGLAEVAISETEVVFAGYGVVAPEYHWNDYADIDARGKTVVVLVNDPGFASDNNAQFKGHEMTYYGRWTYKYEECARQQAAACLIVHDTAAAGYGFNVVQTSFGQRAQFELANSSAAKTPIVGWLSTEGAGALFAKAGLNFAELKQQAHQPGFKAQPLAELAFSASVSTDIVMGSSDNVLASLKGHSQPDEWIVVTSHWDHLGAITNDQGGMDIYNGAIDNAGGVAALLEIAAMAKQQGGFARSVLFLVVTLEESGLLGTKHYAANPVVPLKNTVANINIDALLPVGATKDVWIIGLGQSELDDVVRQQAAKQQRTVAGNPEVEKGFFYRSDQFAFAQVGVPGLFMGPGTDAITGGIVAGEAALNATQNRYHTPDDTFSHDWEMGAMLQDTQLHYLVIEQLANSAQWPQWSAHSEFYQLGKALRADK
ncbi:M28 family peptidase [Arsukibacterium sp.]|uniref:M28 family peptidase n=1 Tax=Arsukibacterium sp. TaxID=1977258 RepID=UPI002FDB0E47